MSLYVNNNAIVNICVHNSKTAKNRWEKPLLSFYKCTKVGMFEDLQLDCTLYNSTCAWMMHAHYKQVLKY